MDFIRGAVITIFGLVLAISLILMNLSITIASSLQYGDLKPALQDSVKEIMNNSIIVGSLFNQEEVQNLCSFNEEYSLYYGNQTFVIPCEIAQQGKDSIVDYVSGNFIDQIYYTEYNCEFWECVKTSEVPFVLISDKARVYWIGKAILLAVMSLVLFLLIFFVSGKRPSKFIATGILLILSALPFRNLGFILKIAPPEFSQILSLISQKAHLVFIIILILGIIFILFGIVAKLFGWNMKFKEDSSEINKDKEMNITKSEVKKIVKEEISKKDIVPSKDKKKN